MKTFSFPKWTWVPTPAPIPVPIPAHEKKAASQFVNENVNLVLPLGDDATGGGGVRINTIVRTSLYILSHPNIQDIKTLPVDDKSKETSDAGLIEVSTPANGKKRKKPPAAPKPSEYEKMGLIDILGAAALVLTSSGEYHNFVFAPPLSASSSSCGYEWMENLFILLDRSECIQIFNGEFYFGILRKYLAYQQRMVYWRFRMRDVFLEINSRTGHRQWPSFRDLYNVNVTERLSQAREEAAAKATSVANSDSTENEKNATLSGGGRDGQEEEDDALRFPSLESMVVSASSFDKRTRLFDDMMTMAKMTSNMHDAIEKDNHTVRFLKKPNAAGKKRGEPITDDSMTMTWDIMGRSSHSKPTTDALDTSEDTLANKDDSKPSKRHKH